jgi:hypothetical protein
VSPQEHRTRVKFVGGGHVVTKWSFAETRRVIEKGLQERVFVELELAIGVKSCVNPYCVTLIERT